RHGLLSPTRHLFWPPQRECTVRRSQPCTAIVVPGIIAPPAGERLPACRHHQPQHRPEKSIAANAAPPRSVQPSFCAGFAPQKLLLRFGISGFLSKSCALEYLASPFPHLEIHLLDRARRGLSQRSFLG